MQNNGHVTTARRISGITALLFLALAVRQYVSFIAATINVQHRLSLALAFTATAVISATVWWLLTAAARTAAAGAHDRHRSGRH